MRQIRFVDTTIRDGQQSLWATGMQTSMLLPILQNLDDAGFDAIELSANSFEKKMIRELKDDPFERLRLARERVRKTPLRIIRGRSLTSFQIAPQAYDDLWYERMAAYGLDEVRTSDSSHTVAEWRRNVETARKHGIKTVLNLIFSISPRHTDEYYAGKAREAAGLKPYRICLKDPGALLTPKRLQTLVPAVLANTGDIPVEFHTHCNTGLGGLCTLEAIELGIDVVNTAIPPLAEGSSNPSTFDVARNARVLGYQTMLDEAVLSPVEAHFREVAREYGFPVGVPLPYDAGHYIHQVPGGMISNLRFQLSNAGLSAKLPQVLEEIGRVRADFGYPIMVTPYSQFMGAQAVMNVIAGERYKTVSDEIIQYALGFWGEDERSQIAPDVRDKVLARPRAAAVAASPPREMTREEVRKRFGGPGVSDDDIILRIFTDADQVAEMRSAASRPARSAGKTGLVGLLDRISGCSRVTFLKIETRGLRLVLGAGHGLARPGASSTVQRTETMSGNMDALRDLDVEKIGQLVEILDRSTFDHLTLEIDDFRLTVGSGSAAFDSAHSTPPPAAPVAVQAAAPAPATPAPAQPAPGPAASAIDLSGTVEVTATTMGRFYARPDPASPPFVSVGATIGEDDTVGLIEVMKLFNSVQAGLTGEVVEICVEDNQFVEYGQVLVRIRPQA